MASKKRKKPSRHSPKHSESTGTASVDPLWGDTSPGSVLRDAFALLKVAGVEAALAVLVVQLPKVALILGTDLDGRAISVYGFVEIIGVGAAVHVGLCRARSPSTSAASSGAIPSSSPDISSTVRPSRMSPPA